MTNFFLRSGILFSLSVLSFPVTGNAATLEVDSTITAATVYNDRAALTRTATVQIPQAGKHEVVLTGLPGNLDPDSLRAKGSSNADVTLGAINAKISNLIAPNAPEERTLQEKIEELNDKKNVINIEIQSLTARKQFFEALSARLAEQAKEDIEAPDVTAENWNNGSEIIYQGILTASKEIAAKNIEVRALDELLRKLNADLTALRSGQGAREYQVTLPVESSAAGKLDIELIYQIPGASWQPVYDARLNTEKGTVALTQYATVHQNSGEDWRGVSLTLSTAQPSRGANLPELTPMWVSLYDPNAYLGKSHGGAARSQSLALSDSAVMNYAAAPEAEMKEVQQQSATISNNGFIGEYEIKGAVTLPADGGEKRVLIGTFESESVIEAHIRPQVSPYAYLIADLTLKGEAPVLPGQVSLFRDGAFVGRTHLPFLRPGKSSEMNFGIDDGIVVETRVLKDTTGEDGIISKDRTVERHYLRSFKNLHQQPVNVVLRETTPAAQHKDIEVKLDQKKTSPGYKENADDITGMLEWRFALPPAQEKEIQLGWSIRWPEDKHIQGLE